MRTERNAPRWKMVRTIQCIVIGFDRLSVGYFIQDNFLADGKTCLFGIVDGHGGYDVTAYLTANFASVNELHEAPKDTTNVLGTG